MHDPQPIDFAPTPKAIISLKPNLGIICRSGLSGLAEDFCQVVMMPYKKIPGFGHSSGPSSTLSLHGILCADIE
jgi:purine-nucleoside phosphorylase